ncbi:hypothetical protein BSLA_03r1069 [Burkholderia stabilis]|nr:hypothetical protein BSLA_03r1069 [Burkholderia stabilis]
MSRPGEFHPQPLAEPDVSLSTHPAPIIQPPEDIPFPSAQRQSETDAPTARGRVSPAFYGEREICTCASSSASGSHSCVSRSPTSPSHGSGRSTAATPSESD